MAKSTDAEARDGCGRDSLFAERTRPLARLAARSPRPVHFRARRNSQHGSHFHRGVRRLGLALDRARSALAARLEASRTHVLYCPSRLCPYAASICCCTLTVK